MIALFRTELKRLLSRRVLKILTILVIATFLLSAFLAFINSDNSSPQAESADRLQEKARAQCVMEVEANPELYPPDVEPEAFCADQVFVEDPRFRYEEMMDILPSIGLPLLMLGWLLGATSIGAEWSHRTITMLLTWHTSRVKVLLAKILATAVITFLWMLLFEVVFSLLFLVVAKFRGTMDGVDRAWLIEYVETMVRVGGVAVIASMLGFALATIGRNTSAALGVGFVYLAVIESLVRGFKAEWVPWLVGDNLGLVLAGPEEVTHLGHSQLEAGLILIFYAVLMLGIAFAIFRRREMA